MNKVKGYKSKDEERRIDPDGDLMSSMIIMDNLKNVKKYVQDTIDEKVGEADEVIEEARKVTKESLELIESKVQEFEKTAIDLIKDIKLIPHIEGKPGKDVIHEEVVQDVISRIPTKEELTDHILAKVPKLDEQSLFAKFIKAIPENKASLKIIQEKFETDPMTVVDKILNLPEGKFKLKSSNIDGLDQTIRAFQHQLGTRGYVHGGGDTVIAGTGITVTTNSAGKKVISATGDLSVSLSDVSANSTTAPTSIYTMTTGIDVIFKSSDGNNMFRFNESTEAMYFGSGVTTFTVVGSAGGLIGAMGPANTYYIPFTGQNTVGGTTASVDMVLGNNIATDLTNYTDWGLSSSNNADPLYTAFGAGFAYWYNQSGGMSLGTANNFPVHIFSGGTLIGNIRLTVLGTGNVGIGTTSPGFKLEVNGDIAANTTGNTSIRVIRSGTEYGALFNLQTSSANANNIDVNLRATNASGGINFMTGGSTTRMRIDFNGNVMIGTSLATDTIGSLLEVYTPNSGTTVTSFQNPTITILNSDTTNNNYSSLAFRSLDAVGARFTGARISGVFTSHTAGAGTGEMAFLTQLAGTVAERMRLNNTGLSTLVRLRAAQGVDVASANDLTLGTDGNCFEITGTTQINAITTANWTNGSRITLLFTSTPTVKHNTAGGGGTAVILLAGAADFVATAGDTLSLIYSEIGGTNAWREVSRAVI